MAKGEKLALVCLRKGRKHMAETRFPHLFEPIQIGPLKLKNRIVMPPMGTNFADPSAQGFITERHKSYYGERAKGGTGLIIFEGTRVNPKRMARKGGPDLYDDRFIAGFRELVELIKAGGARCAVQIADRGRIGNLKVDFKGEFDRSDTKEGEYAGASAKAHPMSGVVAEELSSRALEDIAGYFADAARRARAAGFDAVELHGAHGVLLNEFLSPYSNKRTDEFGGSLEGRARFPLMVVRRVREAMGNELVLSYRMSVVEFVEGGLDLRESIRFAKMLEKEGVQLIHVSAGLNETPSAMNRTIPPMSFPRGRLVPYAAEMKRSVTIPVIVVQRINTPELAEEIIREGKADLVATGRALVSDPDWPRKAREGRVEEIRRCIACNQGCMEQLVQERSMTCLHNPEVGVETKYAALKKPGKKKNVLVVGGGVAGMEAACVCAAKGYKVKLIEREDQLGGTARVASILSFKKEFNGVIEYLQHQMKVLGIEVRLSEEATAKTLKEEDFDEIIIATGSTAVTPQIKLSHKTCEARLARKVLMNPEGIGAEVAILGGGSVGVEVAEYLCHLGKKVTVIEMLDKICSDLGPLNRVDVVERIEGSSVTLMLKTKVLELTEEGLRVLKDGREQILKCPDTVVIAMGASPNPLPLPAEERVHAIGDCRKVGNAMEAIHDAFQVAIHL
jgi:2,4-dienoyl-CoA reductase-like NADH-dependent reductase (Old Yellow Enzyme family)/thioredoxin reductase